MPCRSKGETSRCSFASSAAAIFGQRASVLRGSSAYASGTRVGTIVVLPVVDAVVGDNEDGGALAMRRAQLQEVRCQVGVKVAHQPIRWLVPLEVDLRRGLKVGGPEARSDPVGVAACPVRACHEMRGTPT